MASLTNKHLTLIALAVLAIPSASAANPVGDTAPDSIVRALDAATVSVSYSLQRSVGAGDVLPICGGADEVPANQTLLGTVKNGCFQPYNHAPSAAGPLGICDPVLVKIQPLTIKEDQHCIDSIQDWITRMISGEEHEGSKSNLTGTSHPVICGPVKGSIVFPDEPYIVIREDEYCIQALQDWIAELLGQETPPLPVQIQVQL